MARNTARTLITTANVAYDVLAPRLRKTIIITMPPTAPFMVIGAVGGIVMMIVFLNLGAKTSYATFAVVISVLAVFLAIAYAPWMASFTETVEKRNPALTATGLAVWGWIIRVVIAISVLILPSVISSMTPLVTYGTQAATIAATYPQQLATLAVIDPSTQAAMG